MSALNQLRDIGAGAIGQELLGCCWGRTVNTEDDPEPCMEQATSVVVVHNEDGWQRDVKLCERHRERLLAETTPHDA